MGRSRSGPDSAGAATEILFERVGAVGLVTLNRPASLNALTLEMIRALAQQLRSWSEDPGVRAFVLRGAGDWAFCAGGDVVRLWWAALDEDAALTDAFFREEYHLNRDLSRFPKTQISILDGVTMGGGVGVSIYGSHRVVTERTVFAMPETAIGFFCDVGASWFLPRMPGRLGLYLALTGARLTAGDLMACGVGTHFVPSARIPELLPALTRADWVGDGPRAADNVLEAFAEEAGPARLTPHRDAIDRCFGGASVEQIAENLGRDGTGWARETLEVLGRMSPTSLKVVFRELRRGEGLDLEGALAAEFRVSQRILAAHDFREGVRAGLVDRDRAPRWSPVRLEEVGEEEVEVLFRPLGPRELWS